MQKDTIGKRYLSQFLDVKDDLELDDKLNESFNKGLDVVSCQFLGMVADGLRFFVTYCNRDRNANNRRIESV